METRNAIPGRLRVLGSEAYAPVDTVPDPSRTSKWLGEQAQGPPRPYKRALDSLVPCIVLMSLRHAGCRREDGNQKCDSSSLPCPKTFSLS